MNRYMHVDVEVGVERFAQELANKSNEEQCAFFNAFAVALWAQCKDEYHVQLQCHSIREGECPTHVMTDKAKDICGTLSGEFKKG
jgi:hypothetical protein